MQPQPLPFNPRALDAFVALIGRRKWAARLADIELRAAVGVRTRNAVRQRHGLELAIERLRAPLGRPHSSAELHTARLAADMVSLDHQLGTGGRKRLRDRLAAAIEGDGTLVPFFHLLRTASLQRRRGFNVEFTGLDDGTPWDLVIRRDQQEAEISCEVVSAEVGRLVPRRAWVGLTDQVEADMRTWLAFKPGRYLLAVSLPSGLHERVHARIRDLLRSGRRWDQDDTALLRLTPLALTEPSLRRQFGTEAHLSVVADGASVLVMVARAGALDEIGAAVRQRLVEIAPNRLSGCRPGILAMFVEDVDREEWRGLRERLELEGEARQFLAGAAAKPVVAVTCVSRFELLGLAAPDAAEDGELRFRNPAHPASKTPALAPAVMSSV